jgi:hypothetical protein
MNEGPEGPGPVGWLPVAPDGTVKEGPIILLPDGIGRLEDRELSPELAALQAEIRDPLAALAARADYIQGRTDKTAPTPVGSVHIIVTDPTRQLATLHFMGCTEEVPMHPCWSSQTVVEQGLSELDVYDWLASLMSVKPAELRRAFKLKRVGNSGKNLCVKPGLILDGRVMKNNSPRPKQRAVPLTRLPVCDMCGRVVDPGTNKACSPVVRLPSGVEIKLNVCLVPECPSGQLTVREHEVVVDKNLNGHTATARVRE